MNNEKKLLLFWKIFSLIGAVVFFAAALLTIHQYQHRDDFFHQEIQQVTGEITKINDYKPVRYNASLTLADGSTYMANSVYGDLVHWAVIDEAVDAGNAAVELEVCYDEDKVPLILGMTLNGDRLLSTDDAIQRIYDNDNGILWATMFLFAASVFCIAGFVFLQFFWDKLEG